MRLCASGELVVFHDEHLDRLTDQSGAVRATPWERIKKARVRDAEGNLTDQTVPRLEEVLELLPRDFFVNIEVKFDGGIPYQVARKVVGITRFEQVLRPREVLISSFHPQVLMACRILGREIPRGYLFEDNWRSRLGRWVAQDPVAPAALNADRRLAKPRLFAHACKLGLPVIVWTVNDRSEIERFTLAGAAAIITDRPDIARKAVDQIAGKRAAAVAR